MKPFRGKRMSLMHLQLYGLVYVCKGVSRYHVVVSKVNFGGEIK